MRGACVCVGTLQAANLRRFNEHFRGRFWQSLVSFPVPVDDLVSATVLVESFEEVSWGPRSERLWRKNR
jgi:hypothetical protein